VPIEWRTVRKYKTLTREERDGAIFFSVSEGDRKIISASGKTDKEAALWLVRHVNRIVRETEQLLVDAQLLTVDEIDAAVLADVKQPAASSKP
jgi:DNA-binding PadR family transcriptional regulator